MAGTMDPRYALGPSWSEFVLEYEGLHNYVI